MYILVICELHTHTADRRLTDRPNNNNRRHQRWLERRPADTPEPALFELLHRVVRQPKRDAGAVPTPPPLLPGARRGRVRYVRRARVVRVLFCVSFFLSFFLALFLFGTCGCDIQNTPITSGTTPHCLALDTPYLAMNAVTALAFGAVVYSMASLRPGIEHFLFYYCSLVSGPTDRPTDERFPAD